MWIPRFPEGLLRTDRAQSLPVCGYSSILGGDGEHGVAICSGPCSVESN